MGTLPRVTRLKPVNVPHHGGRGGAAEATVSGTYEFDNATTGRLEQRAVTFHATLVQDPAGWRLSAIH
jgi:hypothetical protein